MVSAVFAEGEECRGARAESENTSFEDVNEEETKETAQGSGVDRRGRGAATRLRSGLRRHRLAPRPRELRRLLRAARVRVTEGNSVEL